MIDQHVSVAVSERRQRIATILAFAGLLIMPVGVAAVDNPRHYIYLRLLAHPYVSTFIGLIMLAVAAFWLITHRRLRVAAVVVITLMAGLVGLGRALLAELPPFGSVSDVATVATSDQFRLEEYRYPGFFSSDMIGLRAQSRAGLLSREGRHDVACFAVPEAEPGDEWLFGRASFTGNIIDITTRDGQHWTASFDPTTPEPISMVNRCKDAPDPFDD